MPDPATPFDLASLRALYRSGAATPSDVLREALRRCAAGADRHAWIALRGADELLAEARALETCDPSTLPLWGVPFAVKDNIDVAGLPTTAGCEAFAYRPAHSAQVVRRLVAAGAIVLGKTNLDQFATGLNGTRTMGRVEPCRNAFDRDFIAGGSSSGSAVATALGMVSFALGTDTAGSGRVPAAFNNLVGLKPTRGVLGASGVVPACRTLDCVSVFAATVDDAATVFELAAGLDPDDAYSRSMPAAAATPTAAPRLAVPRAADLEFHGDAAAAALFDAAVAACEALGARVECIDLGPFLEAARLLYDGPWVAERYVALRPLLETQPDAIHPAVRAIVGPAIRRSAVEAFEAQYRLAELRRHADAVLARHDALLLPTAPTIYRVAEMLHDPLRLNANLGHYTNFVNLLDMAAVAVPAGFRDDGLPFGVTFCGAAFEDRRLLELARRLEAKLRLPRTALRSPWREPVSRPPAAPGSATAPVAAAASVPASDTMAVVVCGAHMSGLPLNGQLTSLGATLECRTRTSPHYGLHALTSFDPPRPGLARRASGGRPIEVEVWRLPRAALGAFFAQIPAPLALGRVELEDGRRECGFLCEPFALDGAPEISEWGGWRAWLARGR